MRLGSWQGGSRQSLNQLGTMGFVCVCVCCFCFVSLETQMGCVHPRKEHPLIMEASET
jgi:hypothetical protein